MTKEQIIEGFRLTLSRLIPNTAVQADEQDSGKDGKKTSFDCPHENSVELRFPVCNGPVRFTVTREGTGFSQDEKRILQLVPETVESLSGDVTSGASMQYSGKIGFGDILVSRFLTRSLPDGVSGGIFIFLVLQDLSFRFYEDKRCSSGFVFTDRPVEYIRKIPQTNYAFYPFPEKLKLGYPHFDYPASFRYVDGRNSYYLVDSGLFIHGVLRLKNPDSFSLVSRIRNLHLGALVTDMPGNAWVSFVGLREEVYVIIQPELQMKWSRNHWQVRDRRIIFDVLDQSGLRENLRELFVSILFALSEIGYGASILIPADDAKLPKSVGKIDRTEIGGILRAQIQSANIAELNSTNSLLGIISSDGMTTLSRDGRILSCGDIIDISEAELLQSQGGGRSQAAIAASFFGLSVKISQNGPISFYRDGRLLLQF